MAVLLGGSPISEALLLHGLRLVWTVGGRSGSVLSSSLLGLRVEMVASPEHAYLILSH